MLFFKYLIVSEQQNLGWAWATQTSGSTLDTIWLQAGL